MSVYICCQKEENVLDWNGLESVFNLKGTKLKYPGGMGAFKLAKIYYSSDEEYTLESHIKDITKPSLVYCFGTSNYYEKGVD